MTEKPPGSGPDIGKSALEALADPEKLEGMQRAIIQLAQDPTDEEALYSAEVAGHIETVIDRMNVSSPNAGDDAEVLLMVGAGGNVLAANHTAQARLGIGSSGNIRASNLTVDSINRLIAQLETGQGDWTVLVAEPSQGPACAYLAMRYPAGASAAAMIVSIGDEWTEKLTGQIGTIFGFSSTEAEVAKLLAAGHSTNQIAAMRNRSVETVRSQVKALVTKTETANQAEMLRLFAQIQRAAEWMDASPLSPPQAVVLKSRSGRQVQVCEFGDPNGRPLMFVHGSIGGLEPSNQMQAALHEHGIRWIGVARPGYGQTDMAPSAEQNLQCASDDLTAVLDHLNIAKVSLLAYSVGAATALTWAAANPDRTSNLVICSGAVPNFNARTQAAMPLGQKAMALAARLSPGIIRVLVKLGIRRMDQAGPEGMGQVFFKGAQADQHALQDPATLHHMWRAYRFHAASQVDAFVQDVVIANGKLWPLPPSLNCPISFVHGAQDNTVPASLAHEFANRLNGTVSIVEGAGHLLPISHSDQVLEAVLHNQICPK